MSKEKGTEDDSDQLASRPLMETHSSLDADEAFPLGNDSDDDMAAVLKSDPPPERLIGSVLGGQYRIQSHLGSGGFGVVFRATQEKTGQLVALKLLRARYGKGAPSIDRQRARFRREMRVCAELHHPHIVRLIDSGQTEAGLLFSVFEYVPGTTLAELLREKGALPVRTTVELMGQVLDALACAHAKGVIHRDLKPSNIMVSTTGSRPQTTVLDFGISAYLEGMLTDDFQNLTITREILGTPSYAAPEQLRGETPSAKSDLYAWGLVFLECLIGRRVVDGSSPIEIAHRQLSSEAAVIPARLQKHWLGTLLRWVLEKDVSRRAGDATEIMDRLLEKRSITDVVDANGYLVGGESGELDARTRAETPREVTDLTLGGTAAGERRQVTAVCCTISVAQAGLGRPPELLDRVLREAQAICADVASQFGGHAAGNLGGQVLFYFGYPRASDTDVRRAAIAALEIGDEIKRYNVETPDIPLELRIGIHTGIVTVLGVGEWLSSAVSGVTSGEAIQMALQASPGSVLVSAESFRYLAPSFQLQPATTSYGQVAYWLIAESEAESDVAESDATTKSPFVGRERELLTLRDAWRSRGDHGTTTMLLGEAGIGKSRLARELRQSLREEGAGWVEARCLPEMTQSALRPLVDALALQFGLGDEDGRSARLEVALIDLGVNLTEAMPLLCPWFATALPATYSPLPFSPQKQKSLLLELLAEMLVSISERKSAPILVEDLHWADPSTLEVIGILVKKIPAHRALLLLTARPDSAVSQWPPDTVNMIELKNLDAADVAAIVLAMTGAETLAKGAVEDVIRRSDGVPLFVEEIVRFIGDARNDDSHASPGEQQVPARLRDLLTGRLDRLGRARETAQIAAAIGREFDYRLLAEVFSGEEASLLADLDQMVSAKLLMRRRHIDSPLYMFRHALIRDAAYESLLASSRATVHGRIAAALESTFPQIVAARPELIAHHLAAAGQKARAIGFAKIATGAALSRCLYHEAVAHATQALGWIDGVSDPKEQAQVELELIGLLAPALMATSGWGSENVRTRIDRAAYLAQRVSVHADIQYAMLWLLLMYHMIRANWTRFEEVQTLAMKVASETSNRVFESVVKSIVGQALIIRGRLREALQECEAALELYDREAHAMHRQHFGQDVEVFTLGGMGMLLTLLGFPERAAKSAMTALAKAEELNSPYNICVAKAYLAGTWHYQCNKHETRETAASLLRDSEAFGIADWPPIAKILGGWANGVVDEPASELSKILAIGNRYAGPYWSFTIAQTEMSKGQYRAAIERIDAALAQSDELSVFYYVPELHRLKGECLAGLAASGDTQADQLSLDAEKAFRKAIEVARGQAAKLPELRAALGLARLDRALRRASELPPELGDVRRWFTEGFQLPELVEAEKLTAR